MRKLFHSLIFKLRSCIDLEKEIEERGSNFSPAVLSPYRSDWVVFSLGLVLHNHHFGKQAPSIFYSEWIAIGRLNCTILLKFQLAKYDLLVSCESLTMSRNCVTASSCTLSFKSRQNGDLIHVGDHKTSFSILWRTSYFSVQKLWVRVNSRITRAIDFLFAIEAMPTSQIKSCNYSITLLKILHLWPHIFHNSWILFDNKACLYPWKKSKKPASS